jgi:hypothetical protein
LNSVTALPLKSVTKKLPAESKAEPVVNAPVRVSRVFRKVPLLVHSWTNPLPIDTITVPDAMTSAGATAEPCCDAKSTEAMPVEMSSEHPSTNHSKDVERRIWRLSPQREIAPQRPRQLSYSSAPDLAIPAGEKASRI